MPVDQPAVHATLAHVNSSGAASPGLINSAEVSSIITCPVCGSDTVKRAGGYARFGAAAAILAATTPSRSRATARLRSSIKPTRSRRSRGREKAGEALPEEATSLGGSNALDARRSIWWKQPGGCSTRPAPLNPRQRRTFRPTGPPENGPSCLGNSGRPRSLTNLTDPPVGTRESDPHLLSKTDPGNL